MKNIARVSGSGAAASGAAGTFSAAPISGPALAAASDRAASAGERPACSRAPGRLSTLASACTALLALVWLSTLAGPAAAAVPDAAAVPLTAAPAPTNATGQSTGRQNPAVVRQSVLQFMQRQTAGLPGEVTIDVGQIDAHLSLPACLQPEPFMAHGSRVWGKTSVGVRCTAPSPWTMYVTANVHVMAEYVAAAAPLTQGQTIGPGDIVRMRGDLSMLPPGVVTDEGMALGHTTKSSLQAGAPLRQDTLRAQQAVQIGQTIRLSSSGPGFEVTTEGRALNNAAEGQTVQARTPTGQIISGIAKAGGILQVAY